MNRKPDSGRPIVEAASPTQYSAILGVLGLNNTGSNAVNGSKNGNAEFQEIRADTSTKTNEDTTTTWEYISSMANRHTTASTFNVTTAFKDTSAAVTYGKVFKFSKKIHSLN